MSDFCILMIMLKFEPTETSVENSLTAIIRKKRRLLKLKQKDIADALKIKTQSYSKIELGFMRVTDEKLEIIAKALSTTPQQLKQEAALKDAGDLAPGLSIVSSIEHNLLKDKYSKLQEALIAALQTIDELRYGKKQT